MMKLKTFSLLLLLCFCILHVGVAYKNEVEIKLEPQEQPTEQKTGFFGSIKNFFRGGSGSSTTTAADAKPPVQGSIPQQRPPPLSIAPAPLAPLGPRPDTPSSSPYGDKSNQPPQWPQVAPAGQSNQQPQSPQVAPAGISSTNVRQQQAGNAAVLPSNIPSPQLPHGQRVESNLPGFSNYQPRKPLPSGIDLSYGGANSAGNPSIHGVRPNLAPMVTSSTPRPQQPRLPNSAGEASINGNQPGLVPLIGSTTPRPQQPRLPNSAGEASINGKQPGLVPLIGSTTPRPQQPRMDIDLRMQTNKNPEDNLPAQPAQRRPSIDSHQDFPALPAPKSPQSPPSPSSPLIPSNPVDHSARGVSPGGTGSNIRNRVSFLPSNGPQVQSGGGPRATDNEIEQLTELLYTKEVNNQLAHIQVNKQGRTRSIDSADEAPNPLLVVDNRALQAPSIVKLMALFDNYEEDTSVNEHVTGNERREENEFLDAVMNTNVMRQAMLFLQNKGIVTPDPKTHRDLVKELWFTQYSRGGGRIGSSGFEHVFVNEVKNGTIIGLHNWVYFNQEEKANRLDYKGYLKELDIGTKAKVIKIRFTHNGLNKPVNSLFIGTSPELELALYTVCFMVRADRTCPVSLGNSKFGIVAYSWRYRGKNLIGSAYPEI